MRQPTRTEQWAPANAVTATLAHSPACPVCAEAVQALTELELLYPLRLDVVDVRSDRGRSLMDWHRPATGPLLLLDGKYFSAGPLPRQELTATLDRHFAQALAALRRDLRSTV